VIINTHYSIFRFLWVTPASSDLDQWTWILESWHCSRCLAVFCLLFSCFLALLWHLCFALVFLIELCFYCLAVLYSVKCHWKKISMQDSHFYFFTILVLTKMFLLSCRNKVFCGVWAWSSTHGKFTEICLWIVHGLRFEESILWDGDAYTLWTLWYQPNTSSSKGSCCIFGPINLYLTVFTFLYFGWVHNLNIVIQLLVTYRITASLCCFSGTKQEYNVWGKISFLTSEIHLFRALLYVWVVVRNCLCLHVITLAVVSCS